MLLKAQQRAGSHGIQTMPSKIDLKRELEREMRGRLESKVASKNKGKGKDDGRRSAIPHK